MAAFLGEIVSSRRGLCALLALVVLVSGVVVGEPAAALPDAVPEYEMAEGPRALPAAIEGEAVVASVPVGPDDVLREPPETPAVPADPVVPERRPAHVREFVDGTVR